MTLAISRATAGASAADPGASSGTIRVVARVVDIRSSQAASRELSRVAMQLADLLQEKKESAEQSPDLEDWLERLEREQVIEGGTVRFEYLPPSSNEPATLQVEWTSN